jgi:GNAT superfamily N-acetyltransferase
MPNRDVLDVVRNKPGDALHILPPAPRWRSVWDALKGEGGKSYTREAFDWRSFNQDTYREGRAPLPEGARLQPIDTATASLLLEEPWSRDIVGNFGTPERYVSEAFGFVVRLEGRVVAAAGCYAQYSDGIEVEVDTHPDFRRLGLARAASRALIAEALRRGCAVHWDAMNAASAHLARSLGYVESERYECLELERVGRGGQKGWDARDDR